LRYLLAIYMDPKVWDSLAEEERQGVYGGHTELQERIKASGEFIATAAFAEPEKSATVTVRAGVASTREGLFQSASAFCCGYYIVECETDARAAELAGLIPDARYTAIEVRPLIA
jgi:hypothetical protein